MNISFYIKKYFKYITIIVLLSFIKVSLSFVNPVLVKKILDFASFFQKNFDGGVLKYFILFFTVLLGIYTSDFFLSIIKLKFSFAFKINEQKSLYEKLMKIKYEIFYRNEAAYYVYRIFQFINDLFMLLSSYLSSSFIALLTIIISLIILFKANVILFFVSFILLPMNYFGYKKINHKLLEKSKNLQEVSASNSNEIINFISNFETIKQYLNFRNFIAFLTKNFKNIEIVHYDINLYAQKTSLFLSFVIDFIKNFVLIYLIYLFYIKSISFSDLIFLNMIFSIYTSGLSELNKININLRDLKVGINFIRENILNQEEISFGNLNLSKVEKIDVSLKEFRYKDKIVLKDVNLFLRPGIRYGIVGDSGCGKSTFLKLLVRLYDADKVRINEEDIRNYSLESLRNKIFLLPHTPQIFPISIKDNILIGANEDEKERYNDIIKTSFLKELYNRHNFDSTILSSGVSLSSGEKQAICAARVFVKDYDVIIFDEATSAMDSKLEDLFFEEMFNKLNVKDKIFIFVSHRLSTIKKCDVIILMKDKTINNIFDSYQKALLNPFFVKLYKSQI